MPDKAMPIVSSGVQRRQRVTADSGRPQSTSSPVLDWILTLPMLLLLPILLVPLLVLAAGGPTLGVAGTLRPAETIVVSGTNYAKGEWVELRWDGAQVTWLPSVKTNASGKLVVSSVLPVATAPGTHLIEARMKKHGRDSKARPEVVAQVTVTVVARSANAPVRVALPSTPTPTPTVAVTPSPSSAAPTTPPTSTATPAAPTATASATVPTPSPVPSSSPVATPVTGSAVGYGSQTIGGAGGRVLAVTNLSDSGTGSLRSALESSGPRVVVFRVGGTISLTSDLKVSDPFVTVAGETAPSPIVIRGGGTIVLTHEVVIRHVRFRPGDDVSDPSDVDALTLNGVNAAVWNVLIDHVTMIWGPDIGGLAVLGDVRDVTVSNSIMGEGLYLSRHAEGTALQGGHSHAANLTQLDAGSAWPRRITFVGNLFTTADTRIPRLQGAECVDLVNNVIYNWGKHAAHGNPRSVNLVNNYYRSGPESTTNELWDTQTSVVAPNPFAASVYEAGNHADGFSGVRGGSSSVYASSTRCTSLSVAARLATDTYPSVLATVGATLPSRDSVDARIVSNVQNRAGSFVNGSQYPGSNPYWP